MKKLFTIDDFMIVFVTSLGYGFGDSIARLMGWPGLICLGVCLAVGIALEAIIYRIAFSRAVQKNPINWVFTYVTFILIFLIGHVVSVAWMGVSMVDYLLEEFAYVIGLPILDFVLKMLVRVYRVRKIRQLYGDGSEGFVFDVSSEDIEEVNRQNHPVHGEYDADFAVRTRTGIFIGEKQKNTLNFFGIPYAKPPVGELRWKAPEPLPASDDVFEAQNFGASAIQIDHKGSLIRHHRQSEDCLSLNISVAPQSTEGKKPVLVLFHHGDFTYGSSVDPLLSGGRFVGNHSDIVFVSFNYRLGVFGFIDFSEVPGGEACPDALNLGLLDQVAALKWIKENISAFGGDPNQITVLGFESGATSILLLAASRRAQGLFQRAFAFSGNPELAFDTPEASRALAGNLLKETRTTTMDELLRTDAKSLKDAAQRLWPSMCAPTCDGAWIPVDVYRACQEGTASGIEFIIGISSNDRQAIRSLIGHQKYKELIAAGVADMHSSFDGSMTQAVKTYTEKQQASSTALEVNSKLLEQWNDVCTYRTAVKLSEGGNKVHLMYWNQKPLIENLGSGTADAVATLLGNSDALQMYGSVMNEDLSEILQTLLYKFIRGDALQLYNNEIAGVDPFDWKPFPQALIISDEQFECDTIVDRVTEIRSLSDYMVK